MKRLTLIVLTGALGATGCSSPDENGQNAVNAQAPIIETLPGGEGNADLPEIEGSATNATSAADAALRIPSPILGRWGLVQADCTATHGNAKGLLEIADSELLFYESRGRLTALREREPTRIVGDFAFSGEGLNWERRILLEVQDNGRTLIRRDYGGDDVAGQFHYTRCGG